MKAKEPEKELEFVSGGQLVQLVPYAVEEEEEEDLDSIIKSKTAKSAQPKGGITINLKSNSSIVTNSSPSKKRKLI